MVVVVGQLRTQPGRFMAVDKIVFTRKSRSMVTKRLIATWVFY